MTTEEIAKKLCAHCDSGTEYECLDELYSENAVSVEPMAMEGQSAVRTGIAEIKAKHEWWDDNFEVHAMKLEGPFVNGDQFNVVFEIDCTEKASGQRWTAKEVGLYEVADGKIVKETFFMAPMG